MNDNRIRHITLPGIRLHLRRGDPNLLWINGQNLLVLNQTAAEFIEAFIEVMSRYTSDLEVDRFKGEIAARMQQKYPETPTNILLRDFDVIYGLLIQVARGDCPISDVQLSTRETGPRQWTAPPRIDLALTYTCNNNCGFCYTGGPRRMNEMDTAGWKKALDILWDSGIPQVVFTGGEPTLRPDLVELVDHAQEFVTGLITNGRRLKHLAQDLRRVSLDYVQVSLESHLPAVHDRMVGVSGAWQETSEGIRQAISAGLEVITNTTLTRENMESFPDLISKGPGMGLKVMACNTLICSGRGSCSRQERGISPDDLKKTLARALESAQKAGIRLEWYSPTCYKQFNPLEFGLGTKSCSAAQYNLTIEPDGSVIPCQSWLQEKVGHILQDPWREIWEHPVCTGFRERNYMKNREECQGCQYLNECQGGCPLEYAH
jgi:radical SAM protein with 4Fe4S-binding SPASM domain